MKILDGKRMGSVTVFEDTLLLGEIFGDVILNRGHLELKGKILGNLYVRKGTCRMLGIVRGNIENERGDVEIFGAVHGKVVTKRGYTYINPGSKVKMIENAVRKPVTAIQ
jgi:predicted phosphodiesterase